jgi:hypothetical protein
MLEKSLATQTTTTFDKAIELRLGLIHGYLSLIQRLLRLEVTDFHMTGFS